MIHNNQTNKNNNQNLRRNPYTLCVWNTQFILKMNNCQDILVSPLQFSSHV